MPKPSTLLAMVEVIRASRLVAEPRLQAALAGHDASRPDDLLDRLVTDGTCTAFQAEQLAMGRWRGFVAGPYRLLDRLGGGGMGQVFLAEHATTGRAVAVKLLAAELADDATARARFAREAQAAAALAHPNIVRVLDLDTEARPPYLVMEHVDGVSLQAAVARHGTFAAGWAARVGHQVALALQCAADAGLVHRDVKPANVLLDRAGECKLLDLGIVLIDGVAGLTLVAGARTILGTADYLAPEQAVDSSGVDARADLYALGGTLYYLLSGAPPFPDGSPVSKLVAKQVRDPERIDRLRPDLPAGLADAVHTLLARRPGDRYPTAAAAAAALAPFATAGPEFLVKLFAGRHPAPDARAPRRQAFGDERGLETAGTLDESAASKTDIIPFCLTRLAKALPPVGSPPPAAADFDFDFATASPTVVVSRAEIAAARLLAPRRGRRSRARVALAVVAFALALAAATVGALSRPPRPAGRPPAPLPPLAEVPPR